jgi:hypothetical protein
MTKKRPRPVARETKAEYLERVDADAATARADIADHRATVQRLQDARKALSDRDFMLQEADAEYQRLAAAEDAARATVRQLEKEKLARLTALLDADAERGRVSARSVAGQRDQLF